MCKLCKSDEREVLKDLSHVIAATPDGRVFSFYECPNCHSQYTEETIRFDGNGEVERRKKRDAWAQKHPRAKILRSYSKIEQKTTKNGALKPWHFLECGYIT